MKRLVILGVLAVVGCGDAPATAPPTRPSATVDPLALVTICKATTEADTTPVTMAVAEAAAQNLVAKGHARRGPCAPHLSSPNGSTVIAQLVGPWWCAPSELGFEIPFTFEEGRDPQKRVAAYEILVQHAGSPLPLFHDVVHDTVMIRKCGYIIEANRTSWWWRVRALDHQGQPGPWSDSVSFSFGPLPAPLAPMPLAPANGTVFSVFPRITTVAWSAFPGATSYDVEWSYCEDPANFSNWAQCGAWSLPMTVSTTKTATAFSFVGAQAGRWRVRANTAVGPTPWSPYWYFVYTI